MKNNPGNIIGRAFTTCPSAFFIFFNKQTERSPLIGPYSKQAYFYLLFQKSQKSKYRNDRAKVRKQLSKLDQLIMFNVETCRENDCPLAAQKTSKQKLCM